MQNDYLSLLSGFNDFNFSQFEALIGLKTIKR